MKISTGIPGLARGGTPASLLLYLAIALLAALLVAGHAGAATAAGVTAQNPQLANLQIEIWPEFDRPDALVILKGEIAPGVALPADVSVRIPAASGGPLAVAFTAAAKGDLLTAKYESAPAGTSIEVKFSVPERFFHVEFYQPIVTTAPARSFTYVWPGDLATTQLAVVVQEPAGVTDLFVTPTLEGVATGDNGLKYRSAELGAYALGKQQEIKVNYTKTDPRTSAAILNPRAADSSTSTDMAKAAAAIAAAAPASTSPYPSKQAALSFLVGVVAVLAIGGIVALIWSRRRKPGGGGPH